MTVNELIRALTHIRDSYTAGELFVNVRDQEVIRAVFVSHFDQNSEVSTHVELAVSDET